MDDIIKEKKRLRKEMFQKRSKLLPMQKSQWDEYICEQLESIINEKDIKVVHSYLPIGSEVNIFPLIQKLLDSGIKVVCPKTLPNRVLENRVLVSLNELEEGVMKTFHPKEAEIYVGLYDFIIVPGLAFDENNYRVGYGGGYYDGFLTQQPNAMKVGVFYPVQRVDKVPTEPHDVALNMIIIPQ